MDKTESELIELAHRIDRYASALPAVQERIVPELREEWKSQGISESSINYSTGFMMQVKSRVEQEIGPAPPEIWDSETVISFARLIVNMEWMDSIR